MATSSPPNMSEVPVHLIVTQPFGDFAMGARIDDPILVENVLANHPSSVVKVSDGEPGTLEIAQPEPEAPAAKKAPASSAPDKPESEA